MTSSVAVRSLFAVSVSAGAAPSTLTVSATGTALAERGRRERHRGAAARRDDHGLRRARERRQRHDARSRRRRRCARRPRRVITTGLPTSVCWPARSARRRGPDAASRSRPARTTYVRSGVPDCTSTFAAIVVPRATCPMASSTTPLGAVSCVNLRVSFEPSGATSSSSTFLITPTASQPGRRRDGEREARARRPGERGKRQRVRLAGGAEARHAVRARVVDGGEAEERRRTGGRSRAARCAAATASEQER